MMLLHQILSSNGETHSSYLHSTTNNLARKRCISTNHLNTAYLSSLFDQGGVFKCAYSVVDLLSSETRVATGSSDDALVSVPILDLLF